MNTVIDLKFDKADKKALAGVKEGKQIFNQQVAPRLSDEAWKGTITIRFPKSIIIIGTSFGTGFTQSFVEKMGYYDVLDRVKFVTSSERLTEALYHDLI